MMDAAKRQDGAVLHFLKEFPAWCILLLLIILFLSMYHFTREDFIPRIIDGLVGAMLTAIIAQRPKPNPSTTIQADTVETPAVTTETITDSTVNTESLNIKKEKK